MRKCILPILILIACTVHAQDSIYLRNDTLHTTSGFKIYPGQELTLGTGTMPNGDFRYITISTASFYYIANKGHGGGISSLSRKNINQHVTVFKIDTRGSEKKGYLYYPIINIGSNRYQVDSDGAIATGEIVVPNEFKSKPAASQSDVYDKLKKLKELLDSGAITQEEYDAQKKKLLEQP